MKIAVTGSIAFDYLMSFPGKFLDYFLPDKLDRISVSFLVDSLRKERGGCAANIAFSLALLRENPLIVGTAGKDFEEYGRFLEQAGVDTSLVKVIDQEYTASFFANTDQTGNQICSFYTGAMQFAKEISLKKVMRERVNLAIISPNDPEAMIRFVGECREMKIPFIFDPGQQIVRLSPESLREGTAGAKILIFNEYEHEMFKKKTGLSDDQILGLAETLIVTMGDKGSLIQSKEKSMSIPIVPPRQIMDPTGVGDAFRAGIVKGIVHGLPLEIAGRMGSLAAVYVLETEGPQSHHYTLEEFVERYNLVFGKSDEIMKLTDKSNKHT